MGQALLFREAADPEADGAPRPNLVPVVQARVLVAVPLVDAFIVGLLGALPRAVALRYGLAWAVVGAFLADLTVLNNTTRGWRAGCERQWPSLPSRASGWK